VTQPADRPLDDAHLRYLFVTVHDLPRMLAFYRDGLGLAVEYVVPGHVVFLRLGAGGQSLALHAGRADPPLADDATEHWFAVLDVTDLEATRAALRARGVVVGEPFDVPYGRAVKIRDPEGNVVELHQPER